MNKTITKLQICSDTDQSISHVVVKCVHKNRNTLINEPYPFYTNDVVPVDDKFLNYLTYFGEHKNTISLDIPMNDFKELQVIAYVKVLLSEISSCDVDTIVQESQFLTCSIQNREVTFLQAIENVTFIPSEKVAIHDCTDDIDACRGDFVYYNGLVYLNKILSFDSDTDSLEAKMSSNGFSETKRILLSEGQDALDMKRSTYSTFRHYKQKMRL